MGYIESLLRLEGSVSLKRMNVPKCSEMFLVFMPDIWHVIMGFSSKILDETF